MESCQVTISSNNKIEFQGVRNTYPFGEQVVCYFTVPTSCRPEIGDWVGIFPVGWSSLNHCLVKKMVKPENVWGTSSGQYCKVEFDSEVLPRNTEQYYQFVYVKSGEYIRGASTPFTFVPFGLTTGLTGEESSIIYRPTESSSVFGGRQTPECGIQSGSWYQQTPRTLEQVVMREMESLQHGISGLEQCLGGYKTVYPQQQQGEETTTTYTQSSSSSSYVCQFPEFTGNWKCTVECQEPQQIKKYWQSRIVEVQQMLGEQVRIEQAQRRLEQLNLISLLKSYERHIMNVQRRESEIRNYFNNKMQKQIVEFEQKVNNIMKLNGEICGQQQPEHYVRKYEQLLREKVELDQQKRIAILHKLRQTIRECERKLREVQNGEQQHYSRFNQILRTKIGQFETKYVQPTIYSGVYNEQVQQELREQLRQYVSSLINEQRREQYNFVKAQKQLVCLVNEICNKLQNLECDVYGQLNIPRIQTVGQYPFEYNNTQSSSYSQVQQLEQQLNELKNTLRIRMLTTPKSIEQLQCGEWIKPICQKLRELEWNLRQVGGSSTINMESSSLIDMPVRGSQWFERRIQNLNQHMKFFERQMEVKQLEEVRLREILCQLRDLECELCEVPQYYEQFRSQYQTRVHQQQQQQQIRQIVELCQYLQTIVREKISQLTSVYEQSPIECYIQTGNHQSWKQMIQHERKLVQLKGLLVEKHHYQQLQQRLGELEQLIRESGCGKQQERCVEQIRCLRTMLEQQEQQLNQHFQQQCQSMNGSCKVNGGIFMFPEHLIQHQQRYERLCQLVNELECQLVEQQIQSRVCGQLNGCYQQQQQQQQVEKMIQSSYESEKLRQLVNSVFAPSQLQQQVTLNLIQQRFERLVQECQRQMPEQFQSKIESIVSFLKNVIVNETMRQKPYFGQQLREKICEFENILNGEHESFPWTTPSQQQQQYYKSISRQVRELKSQIQSILDDWVVVSGCESDDLNNNMTSFSVYEPCDVLSEVTLSELFNKQQQQQFGEEFIPRLFRQSQRQYEGQYNNCTQSKFEQFERQMENIESLVQSDLYVPSGLRSSPSTLNVENLISELESELVKLRLQKEFPVTTTTTTRVVLTPESVCDEISKIVSQNLLTTVVPTTVLPEIRSTIVKVEGRQQQGIQQQQQQTTQSTVFVEPTPFGTQCLVNKVQQKETTQQQF